MNRKTLVSVLLCLAGLASGAVRAEGSVTTPPLNVAGVDFAQTALLASQPLVLNGAGTSNIMSTRASAVGLYLPAKTQQVEQALAMPGAKRLTMVALRELSARDLANALLDRIRQNAGPGEVEGNVLQIAAVGGVFGVRKSMAKGDILTIDYLPASHSTEFRMNGERMGEPIVGEKLYPLMMKIWIGPKVRGATRDALMGGAPTN